MKAPAEFLKNPRVFMYLLETIFTSFLMKLQFSLRLAKIKSASSQTEVLESGKKCCKHKKEYIQLQDFLEKQILSLFKLYHCYP